MTLEQRQQKSLPALPLFSRLCFSATSSATRIDKSLKNMKLLFCRFTKMPWDISWGAKKASLTGPASTRKETKLQTTVSSTKQCLFQHSFGRSSYKGVNHDNKICRYKSPGSRIWGQTTVTPPSSVTLLDRMTASGIHRSSLDRRPCPNSRNEK